MHCPKCGQQQVSEETRFCSRCGFLLSGVAEVVANNGLVPVKAAANFPASSTPRKRGLKQGLFIFLLSFLVVPLLAILTLAVGAEEPIAVAIAAILLTVGGLLRMAYALMFESNQPTLQAGDAAHSAPHLFGAQPNAPALPPTRSMPASSYAPPVAGSWRDTNDLQHQPGSVTDSTTKLLQKDERDQ